MLGKAIVSTGLKLFNEPETYSILYNVLEKSTIKQYKFSVVFDNILKAAECAEKINKNQGSDKFYTDILLNQLFNEYRKYDYRNNQNNNLKQTTMLVEKIENHTKTEKTTELKEVKTTSGWKKLQFFAQKEIKRVVYLGKCPVDGDVFAVYRNVGYQTNVISFVRGNLNNGVWETNK